MRLDTRAADDLPLFLGMEWTTRTRGFVSQGLTKTITRAVIDGDIGDLGSLCTALQLELGMNPILILGAPSLELQCSALHISAGTCQIVSLHVNPNK